MVLVHGEYIDSRIKEYGHIYKKGHRKGQRKDQEKYDAFMTLKEEKYLPMKTHVLGMDFAIDDVESFEECAEILNLYYTELLEFMKKYAISKKSKLHTNFLEEFSVYFLNKLIPFEHFDVYNAKVFAGMKFKTDHTISQIYKDVDFCVGKKTDVALGGEKLIIPAISVEVKTYVDATMLGEIMNTSRKIKGANPGSKTLVVTWSREFTDDHLIEAAYDSSLDEIIELGHRRRNQTSDDDVVEFTKEGLQEYYRIFGKMMSDILTPSKINEIGGLLSGARR